MNLFGTQSVPRNKAENANMQNHVKGNQNNNLLASKPYGLHLGFFSDQRLSSLQLLKVLSL